MHLGCIRTAIFFVHDNHLQDAEAVFQQGFNRNAIDMKTKTEWGYNSMEMSPVRYTCSIDFIGFWLCCIHFNSRLCCLNLQPGGHTYVWPG